MPNSREDRYVVVLITTPSRDEAQKIATALVEEKLAACANVVPRVQSVFRWRGEVCNESEVLVIAKSLGSRVDQIVETVKRLHSYEVPEIIALPIIEGSEDYLKWIDEVVAEAASETD